ncbi:MAG TPA: hypothetical protein V6D16_09160 [Candidatus Obscuribacterales bacterium]
MGYWVKINYERNVYVVDLERVSAFAFTPNGRLSFYLPEGGTHMILNQQGHPEAYQQVMDYVEKSTGHTLP